MKGNDSSTALTLEAFTARASSGATRPGPGRLTGRRHGLIVVGLGVLCAAGCGTGAKTGPDPIPQPSPLAASVPASPPADSPRPPGATVESVTREGVSIEVMVAPVQTRREGPAGPLRAGDDVRLQIRVCDTNGRPLPSAKLSAWLVARQGDSPLRPPALARRVAALVAGDRLMPPEIDFNQYYVVALNDDATVTVVDPLSGFGGTKLLALVTLPGPGADWALAAGGRLLYVSVPAADRVTAIDTLTWTIAGEAKGLSGASKLAIQADGHRLWVETKDGVAAVDLAGMTVASRFATGQGPHDIALDPDDRRVFVTNRGSGTLSMIDARRLAKSFEVDVGPEPVSVAYSSAARAAYVTSGKGDELAVVDGDPPAVTARVAIGGGATSVRFGPGGRLAFVTHPDRDEVSVVDASVNRLVRTIEAGGVPDQVAFSDRLAYIRPRESPMVRLVPLDGVAGGGSTTTVLDVPGGQHPLGQGASRCAAAAIARAPGEGAVLIANPADKAIYYYQEGMSAPAGSFRNASRAPLAVLAVDRSLAATQLGVFEAVARLRNPGRFDVVVLLDSPRFAHAFGLDVADTPGRPPAPAAIEVRPEPRDNEAAPRAGSRTRVRLVMREQESRKPVAGRTDLRILAMLPSRWQRYERAAAAGKEPGVYEFDLVPPEPGTYHVHVECRSAGLTFRNPWSFTLEVKPSS
jgi:YVTN family beta-propeller protein